MERVKDYKKFAKFNYTNGKDAHLNPFKCGDIVLDVDESMDQAIGVVIQVHDADELRTDMFGNASAQYLKAASYEDISRFRPELLPELANYDITGYIVGIKGDESVGIRGFEMEVAHELSFESYSDFLEFETKILEAYSYVYDEDMLYFESYEQRKELIDAEEEMFKKYKDFKEGDIVAYRFIEDLDVTPDLSIGKVIKVEDFDVHTDFGHITAVDFVRKAKIEEIIRYRPELIGNK